MRAPNEPRTQPVCLEVSTTVLAVSREDGRRRRIRVLVPCPLREFEELPVVGRFKLSRGKEIVRFGLDGRPFGLHEELHDHGSNYRTPEGNFAGPWCTEILEQPLPAPQKSEPPLTLPSVAARGLLGDPTLATRWDVEPDEGRIATIKERVAADFAVCAGELLTVAPFPRWFVSGDGSSIDLVKASDEPRAEESYVAAERRQAAEKLAAIRSGRPVQAKIRGQVVEIDQTYQLDRDEIFLAKGVGQYFAERFRVPVSDLPAELVRAWHDVASGLRMRRGNDPDHAIDVIAASFRLMTAFGANPELSGRTGPHPDAWWRRIRDRIVEVDGLFTEALPDGCRPTVLNRPH